MREEFEIEHQKMRESVLDEVLNRINNTGELSLTRQVVVSHPLLVK